MIQPPWKVCKLCRFVSSVGPYNPQRDWMALRIYSSQYCARRPGDAYISRAQVSICIQQLNPELNPVCRRILRLTENKTQYGLIILMAITSFTLGVVCSVETWNAKYALPLLYGIRLTMIV